MVLRHDNDRTTTRRATDRLQFLPVASSNTYKHLRQSWYLRTVNAVSEGSRHGQRVQRPRDEMRRQMMELVERMRST
jgi:hypothetical protein